MYTTIAWANPFKLQLWYGDKGCGKTTNLARMAFKYLAKGWSVYTNEDIPGCYKIDPLELGMYEMERYSVVLIDEAGIHYDNRKYKSFSDRLRDYVKYQRHWKNIFIVISQIDDIDCKIKSMADSVWFLRSYFNCLSVGKKITTKIDIVEATGETESRIVKNLSVTKWYQPGCRFIVWMPKYHKYFNSFKVPELPKKTWDMTPLPAGVEPPRKLRKHFEALGMYDPAARPRVTTRLISIFNSVILKINSAIAKIKDRFRRQDPDQGDGSM